MVIGIIGAGASGMAAALAAAENENVQAELICDGMHVHPSSVRMAFRLFPGRIVLVSDALRCCGMPDGAPRFQVYYSARG